ncbi:sigma factor [Micromonospora sp. BRA006-A]|nr:sigma factor [Micromonospora sp. BRA006-A]
MSTSARSPTPRSSPGHADRRPSPRSSTGTRHIHRYLARRLGSAAADDLVAETFLAAFRRRDRFDTGRPNARPWLYGIATNLVAQQRRAENGVPAAAGVPPGDVEASPPTG